MATVHAIDGARIAYEMTGGGPAVVLVPRPARAPDAWDDQHAIPRVARRRPGVEYATWLKSVVPTATLEIWPEHGHYPHLVDPQRFLDRVREFEARG